MPFILLITAIATLILILGIIYLLQGPPFVATDDETIQDIVHAIKKYKGKKIIDLGSGDGKILIALAKAGIAADGIELNPIMVYRSRRNVLRAGLTDKIHIYWGSFWHYNVSQYDTIVLYGIKHIMEKLGQKLATEMKPGSHIITNFFIFPQWKPSETQKRLHIYTLGK